MIKPQCCLALWAILGAASPALLAQPDRITTRIDSSQSVALTGRVPRQATAQNDAGPVEAGFPLPGITLMLKPSAAQQTDLNQLLLAQQDSTSPNYRQWLTPEQYADRFGVSTGDLAKITAWLESQGFSVDYVARARNLVAFSGTAQQAANAFHTQIRRYTANGVTNYANATNPSIPAALAGIVSGIRGLNDFKLKPRYKIAQPQFNLRGFGTVVGPTDFAAIYDVAKLYNSSPGITGAGQKIAIMGQSEIRTTDITDFRNTFGLGAANLDLVLVPGALGGGNPGYSPGDQAESDLDVEWSGGVAKGATIVFVYAANGVFASTQYAIDQDLAPVLSLSYGFCEQSELVDLDSFRSTAQQANAEGITMLAAAGDTGAADCDLGYTVAAAEAGLAVDAPGSIPEVTSMGGSEFNEGNNTGQYWVNGSATGYIPEMVWNDTAASVASESGLAAGGGGASVYFTEPPWQNGIAPNDGMRHVPDLSFPASSYHDPFYIYTSDYLDVGSNTPATAIGGTSCAAPSMAGVVALLNQYLVSSGAIKQAGLGNINPTLYRLAQSQSSAFHDITVGNNIVPCAIGTPNCTNGTLGYAAGPGYDSASGLGSVDAYNLAHAWNTALATQAVVVASIDQNPVYETATNLWTFTLTLTEEAGFPATLTGLTINGSSFTPSQVFGTATAIVANGSISGTYSLRGLDVSGGPVNVVFGFSFAGVGGATWSTTMTVPFAGPQPNTLLAIGGISNAASAQQTFAPGMLISVYGTGLGDFVQSAAAATVSPLPTYLAGVTPLIYNLTATAPTLYAPLLYVSPGQVNLQLPYELTPGPAELLVYSSWNSTGVTYDFTVSSAAPGIFSYASTSGGASSPIGSGSASIGNEVAIYVTGVGQVNPPPGPVDAGTPDGEPPSPGTVPVPTLPVSVTVGGVQVTNFAYKGIPSWSVGVLQLNFTIPNGVAAGPQPVVVTVGGVPSLPANITIAQ
jgi:uncharacterized protein (TIGR03437 family)